MAELPERIPEVDQNSYIDDMGYDNETPTAEAEKPETVEPAKEPEQTEIKQPEPGQEPVKKEGDAPANPDFMQDYFSEGGELDVNKYMTSMSNDAQPLKIDNPLEADIGQSQAEQKTEREQVLEYRKNITENMFNGLNIAQQYINNGYDSNTALQMAQNDINRNIQEHMDEYMIGRQTEAFESRQKAHDEKLEAAQLAPQSATNINRVANEFGYKSVESFQNAMFHKDFGAETINFLFERENPNYKTEFAGNQQGLQDAYNSWFTKFTSNENNTRYLANQIKMKSTLKLTPQLIKQVRGTVQAQEKGKAQSITSAPVGKDKSPAEQKPDALDDYFGKDSRIDNF